MNVGRPFQDVESHRFDTRSGSKDPLAASERGRLEAVTCRRAGEVPKYLETGHRMRGTAEV